MSRLFPLAAIALLLAGCGPDPRQADLCWSALGALEAKASEAKLVERRAGTEPGDDVVLVYEVPRPEGGSVRKSIACGFAGGGFDEGRLALELVRTEPGGTLSATELFWLRRWLSIPETLPTRRPGGGVEAVAGLRTQLAYGLQLLVNASVLGCVYGLLALGFTLMHGIIGQINLAFGQIYMVGAMAAAVIAIVLGAVGVGAMPLGLLAAFATAMTTAAAYSYACEGIAFRPLRRSAIHVALIAAVGVALFLQEYARLLQGAGNLWLDATTGPALTLFDEAGFPVTALPGQLAIVVLTLVAFVVLWLFMHRTRFGRTYRACAGDIGMAALLGVETDRVVAATFAVSGLLAGMGGFIVVAHYGVANFFMGFAMGFKALVAAIVGGIGSIPGAMLGGLLLALIETGWAGWLDPAWRDVAVFGLLAATLIWRPEGLIALDHRRGD